MRLRICFAFLATLCALAGVAVERVVAADAVSANLAVGAGARPGSFSLVWSVRGPYATAMFTVDPRRVRVTYRKLGALMPVLAVPASTRSFDASRVAMTNFTALQAFVPFRDVSVSAGTYAIAADAHGALTWSAPMPDVALVTPVAYVYVAARHAARRRDPEIAALAKAYAAHDAVARIAFVVRCAPAGIVTVAADTHVRIASFTRGGFEQIGNGPSAVHAARDTGPSGVGDTSQAYYALTAIDVGFRNVTVEGKPACAEAAIGFASAADVARYLSPVPAL